jgi:hypothetical protein
LLIALSRWGLPVSTGSWITGPAPPGPIPPNPIPPYPLSYALLAIAELTEILVVRMDKPIVAAMNIGSLLFIENNSLLWYIRSAKQQLVRI